MTTNTTRSSMTRGTMVQASILRIYTTRRRLAARHAEPGHACFWFGLMIPRRSHYDVKSECDGYG